jgi:hypothetical protein
MKTRQLIITVTVFIGLAMCLGGNCIRSSTLDQPTDTSVAGTVALRNAASRAVHLITLSERADDSNLVQPGEARTVDVDLTDRVLDVVAFGPGNPLSIGAIQCTISEVVNGTVTPTGVEIVWTAIGPNGFECRTGG